MVSVICFVRDSTVAPPWEGQCQGHAMEPGSGGRLLPKGAPCHILCLGQGGACGERGRGLPERHGLHAEQDEQWRLGAHIPRG